MPDPDSIDRPWLDAYPPGVPASYDYPAVPLPRLLDDAAKDFPDVPAVAFVGATLSYRRLADEVDRFATALSRLGVGAGHVVGLALPNCPQHVVALFAVLRLGAVAVECGTDLPPDDLQRVVNDCGCGVLVIHDPVYRALGRLKGRLPTVRHVVGTALADALPATRRRLPAVRRGDPDAAYSIPPAEGVQRYAKLVRGPRAVPPIKPTDPRTTVAVLIPDAAGRLVELTHANLVAGAFQVRLWLPDVQAGREEVLGAAPLSTAEGLVLTLGFGVLSAATMNLLPQRGSDALASGVGRRAPTLLLSSAETFGFLGRLGGLGRALGGVRAALSVGAEPAAEVTALLERGMGAKVRVGFGCGPAAALVCANPVYGSAKPGTAGLPVPDTVVSLRHPADPLRDAPRGEPGLLAVRGPQVTTGYRNHPQDSRADLRDGWLITGVLATIDDEGYVTVLDGAPARQER